MADKVQLSTVIGLLLRLNQQISGFNSMLPGMFGRSRI